MLKSSISGPSFFCEESKKKTMIEIWDFSWVLSIDEFFFPPKSHATVEISTEFFLRQANSEIAWIKRLARNEYAITVWKDVSYGLRIFKVLSTYHTAEVPKISIVHVKRIYQVVFWSQNVKKSRRSTLFIFERSGQITVTPYINVWYQASLLR